MTAGMINTVPDLRFVLSGISVQNPGRGGGVPGGDLVKEILRKAAQ